MQMEMLVSVDVIQWQTRFGERRELGLYFHCQLTPGVGDKEHGGSGAGHVVSEAAISVDESSQLGGRQRRLAIDQYQVQADTQVRHGFGAANGILRGRGADHQARGRQHTPPMGDLDRLIDAFGGPEIVRGNDQSAISQCARPRSTVLPTPLPPRAKVSASP